MVDRWGYWGTMVGFPCSIMLVHRVHAHRYLSTQLQWLYGVQREAG